MFNASAEFYDLIYTTLKDYVAEAAQISHSLLPRLNPQSQTGPGRCMWHWRARTDSSLPRASSWMAWISIRLLSALRSRNTLQGGSSQRT